MMSTIPVLICVDVEPREREIGSTAAKDWEGVEETFQLLIKFRPRLEAATGASVNFSWFFRMDPQIAHTYGDSSWVASRYAETIEQLELAGDELGLHTHAFRWDEARQRWIIDHGDQQWINHCLEMSFAAFRNAFGRSCVSFRFGDHWMNNETMALLESLGVKFDLTVEPGKRAVPGLIPEELNTGWLPDYTAAPNWPYKPSPDDFKKDSRKHGRNLWEIPLSTGKEAGRFPRLKEASLALGIDLQKRHEPSQLNLGVDGSSFRGIMDSLLNPGRTLYLTPVVRSDAFNTQIKRSNMEQNLNLLLSHPLVRRFKFVGPADAIKVLA